LAAALQAFSAVLLWSILSDCIDYDFWKNGERSEGIATAMIAFVNKFGSAFGATIFYGIVVPAGYIAVTKELPEPVQPPSAKFAITTVLSVLPALAFACSFVAFLFFPLGNRVITQMQADLYKKNDEAGGPEGCPPSPVH
jgi:Na+/melibiose symporter-like transporter